MNFLEHGKRDLQNSQGTREKVLINYQALRKLVDDFERLDSYVRATHPDQKKRGAKPLLFVTPTPSLSTPSHPICY